MKVSLPASGRLPRTSSFEATKDSSLNVMSAFRQLQVKAREVEDGRDVALRERDEVKRLMYEKGRRDSLSRSRIMSNTNEKLLGIQADNERVRRNNNELEESLGDINMFAQSLQRDIEDRRHRLDEETAASGEIDSRTLEAYKFTRDLECEINESQQRVNDLNEHYRRFLLKAHEEKTDKQAEIQGALNETALVKENLSKAKAQCSVLERFMDMLMQINTDLVEGVQAKRDATEQISQFVVVPRFAWPKGIVRRATKIVTEAAASDVQKARDIAKARQTAKGRRSGGGGVTTTRRKVGDGRAKKRDGRSTEDRFLAKECAYPTTAKVIVGAPRSAAKKKMRGYLRPKSH